MVYDVWMGLKDNCFCQDGSELEGTLGEGTCKAKAANSPYCRSRPSINPVIRSNINGQRICGKRGGANFLNIVRPTGGGDSPYACPAGTKACGTQGEQALADEEKVGSVICMPVESYDNCPITAITLSYKSNNSKEFEINSSTEPDGLPISSFKFSTSTPCLNYGQTPADTLGQLNDEYTYTKDGCEILDENYTELEGFSLKQIMLETTNSVSQIFTGRY